MASRERFLLGCVWAIVLSAAGCGEQSNAVTVHGHVTYRGEAIANGAVTFSPPTGRPVIVPLSPGGEYATQLPPGEYVVIINVGAELPPGFKEGDPLPPPKIVLPPEYAMRGKSTLKATVAQDQQQPIDFKLE